jgi:Mor family transcriptional regulator
VSSVAEGGRTHIRDRLILQSRRDGASIGELARRYGVSRTRIYQICESAEWREGREAKRTQRALATIERFLAVAEAKRGKR